MTVNKKAVKTAGIFFRRLLKDPEIRLRYQQERARTEIAMAVVAARKRACLTQAELAKKAGTTQGVIARLESGRDSRVPSMPLLAGIARACGGIFEFGFAFRKLVRRPLMP